jgi:hypothetical protein
VVVVHLPLEQMEIAEQVALVEMVLQLQLLVLL